MGSLHPAFLELRSSPPHPFLLPRLCEEGTLKVGRQVLRQPESTVGVNPGQLGS